ncbi:autotransporter [Escherichia coli O145:H28]|nr:autotransporter [Escherichia coli O145:H28]
MKNNKAFYRSALATAIVMALSAPAFAADNAVSTTPVTLDKDKTTLDQDVVINGDKKITAVTIETSDSDKDLNVTFGGHDITAASTVNQDFVEGVKVSGNKNVVINATDSTITAQGEGTYVRTAMVIDSTGDVVVNGGNFVAKNEKGSATGISLEGAQGNNVTLNGMNRPGFPGECFICELRLPDHRFRWKHNKLFLLLPEEYGPAFPAIVDCYTSPPT